MEPKRGTGDEGAALDLLEELEREDDSIVVDDLEPEVETEPPPAPESP